MIYLVLVLSLFISGMIEIILGIPLLFEKIKPNKLYGFRVKKTLSDENIWYKSNRYVGRDFIITGIILVMSSLYLLIFQMDFSILELTIISLILTLVPIFLILFRAFSYLKKF